MLKSVKNKHRVDACNLSPYSFYCNRGTPLPEFEGIFLSVSNNSVNGMSLGHF